MPKPKRNLTLREMVERAYKTLPMILLFWMGTMLLALFVILFWPRTYASTAKLFLQRGRESVGLDPTASTGQTVALQQLGRDSEIKSAIDVIGSRGLLVKVVEELTPDVVLGHKAVGEGGRKSAVGDAIKNAVGSVVKVVRSIDPTPDAERAVVEIEKHIEIEAERKSEVIAIMYEADSPELAQLVVRSIVKQYREMHAQLHLTEGSTKFFDDQSDRLREELDERAVALRDAKNRMGLASINGQRDVLEKQLGNIRSELMKAEKDLFSSAARLTNISQQLQDRPERLSSSEVTKPNAGADLLRTEFFALQIKLEELRSKFTGNHPEISAVEAQVAETAAELRKQVSKRTESTDDINPVHAALKKTIAQSEAEFVGIQAQRKKLAAQEASLVSQIKDLNSYEVEVEQLTRELKVADKKFLAYSESLEEAQIDKAMQGIISNVSVAQPATLQHKPVAPSKLITLAATSLLCLVGAVALALAGIKFDDRLTSEEAIRSQLNVPVLASLPKGAKLDRIKSQGNKRLVTSS
jgi:uncharacterized protein involved in exopolysaccharide biosynthesis